MKRFLSLFITISLTLYAQAQTLEPLHVDGRYLKNPAGDIMTMHGWITNWQNYAEPIPEASDDAEEAFLNWKKTTDDILDRGWKLDYARFHFFNHVTTPDDFDGFIRNNMFETYYLPRIEYLNSKGIYVLLMCDAVYWDYFWTYREVGEPLWQLLMKYWDYVSSHPSIKNNPGVMFELANEPWYFRGSDGSSNDFRTLKAYYQPMVDVIRKNGCQQVIWVPGWDCQVYYAGYATFPIEGTNIGYAVHSYAESYTPINDMHWKNELKVISNMAPIIVSESGWSGYYGEDVNPDYPRLTSNTGNHWKQLVDETGNVSWNFTSEEWAMAQTGLPSDEPTVYNDPEGSYVPCRDWYNAYAKTKITKVTSLNATNVELQEVHRTVYPGDVRPITLMAAFSDGRKWNVAGDAQWTSSDENVLTVKYGNLYVKGEGTAKVSGKYIDGTGKVFNVQFEVKSQLFPLTADGVLVRSGTYDETTHTFNGWSLWDYGGEVCTGLGECIPYLSWNQRGGLDLSAYKYLVIRMNEPPGFTTFDLYDQVGNALFREASASIEISGKSEVVVDLHGYPNFNPSHVTSFAISYGPVSIKEIFLSNDGVNPAQPFVLTTTVKAADMAMCYGDDLPELAYAVSGFGNVGTPKITTTATKTSSVGDYPITAEAGSGADGDVQYKPARMSMVPAPLYTVANDVEIYEGSDFPNPKVTYSGLRNGDSESSAIIMAPKATTTTTRHAPAGTYPIAVSGGQTNDNYHFSNLQAGTLTILEPAIKGTDLTNCVGISQDDWNTLWTASSRNYPTVTTKDGRKAPMMLIGKGPDESGVELMWQEVNGLPNGDYLVELFANAVYTSDPNSNSFTKDGAEDVVYLEANGQRTYVDVRFLNTVPWNGFYRINATVTDGKLRMSMYAEKPGTDFHTLQIKRLVLLPLKGDVNGDRKLTEADVRAIADNIMGKTPKDFDEEAADVNNDKKINAADIVEIVNMMK